MTAVNIKNRILISICHDGPASQAELAKKFGLSASHICEAVSKLVDEGILTESGYRVEKKTRGRKNTLLDFNTANKFALGIGHAGNVLSVGLTTVKGDVLGKESVLLDEDISKPELFNIALDISMRLLRDSCLAISSVLGIGICAKNDSVELFYPSQTFCDLINDIMEFSKLPVVFEPAEEFLNMDERIASIRPEGLYLFGAAKVIRDLLLYN